MPIDTKINNEVFSHCISIDFCGLASSTLLLTNLERDELNPETYKLRKEIKNAVRKIFDKKNLNALNKIGICLKVRFYFSYLYSDYPICLMKAEQDIVWDNLTDTLNNDFYISPPLTPDQFNNSKIYQSQESSLRMIFDIINKNRDLIILGGTEKKINSVQVSRPEIG